MESSKVQRLSPILFVGKARAFSTGPDKIVNQDAKQNKPDCRIISAAGLPGAMKRASTSKILIAAVVLLVFSAFGVFFFARFTDHTDIRNLSGQTVTDVVLQLRDHQTDWAVTKRVASLRPGEFLRVRHSHNDTRAVVEFAIGGQRFRHEEGYIDLWSGEGWRFDIQPGGTVQSGYDHSEKH